MDILRLIAFIALSLFTHVLVAVEHEVVDEVIYEPVSHEVVDKVVHEFVQDEVVDEVVHEPVHEEVDDHDAHNEVIHELVHEPVHDEVVDDVIHNEVVDEPVHHEVVREPVQTARASRDAPVHEVGHESKAQRAGGSWFSLGDSAASGPAPAGQHGAPKYPGRDAAAASGEGPPEQGGIPIIRPQVQARKTRSASTTKKPPSTPKVTCNVITKAGCNNDELVYLAASVAQMGKDWEALVMERKRISAKIGNLPFKKRVTLEWKVRILQSLADRLPAMKRGHVEL